VTIPNSVKSIGSNAFSLCNGLTSLAVEDGNAVYDSRDNCNAIIKTGDNELILGCQNTIIPNSVTSIGLGAFSQCSGLTSVTIPNSVTSIGSNAFEDCSGLTSVTIPGSVISIGNGAFSRCDGLESVKVSVTDLATFCNNSVIRLVSNNISKPITLIDGDGNEIKEYIIPNGVTFIGSYAFYGCSGLTSVTIPNSVTSIGSNAFSGCSGLESVIVPVTDISAFCNNTIIRQIRNDILTSITLIDANGNEIKEYIIPYSVTSIGNYAFSGCSGLTSVTIPSSVTSIGSSAFLDCSGFTSVPIPNSVTSIGNYAFQNCNKLSSITIPNSVTSIGWNVFSGCTGLETVTIHCSSIGSWFSGLTSIKEVSIGDEVTIIEGGAFSGCSGLTSVTIPNSVTSIGSSAFYNCI